MPISRCLLPALVVAGALALAPQAQAAPVLLSSPPTGTIFPLEFKVELEREKNAVEAKAKVKYERKSPNFKGEQEAKTKAAPGTALTTPIPFVFSAAAEAGGVRFGFDAIPALGLAARSILVPTAGLLTLNLLELEVKLEGRTSTARLTDLAFNGEVFLAEILLATPALNDKGELKDEAKAKRFFALPGGAPFTAPFAFAGTLQGGGAAIEELEVKLKLGTGSFVAPPLPPGPDPTPVPEPASAALLLAGLAGIAAALRRRRG